MKEKRESRGKKIDEGRMMAEKKRKGNKKEKRKQSKAGDDYGTWDREERKGGKEVAIESECREEEKEGVGEWRRI